MTKLSVNVNKVAALRNTRPGSNNPSVIRCAEIAIANGAKGITVHPRPDQRHIKPDDVYELSEMLKNHPGIEFNIEGNPFIGYMHFAEQMRPTQCTLVPDDPGAATSDHGWDVQKHSERLLPVIRRLKELGCRVSLFMDPDAKHMELAKALGADRVELYTEPYAAAFARGARDAAKPYTIAARRAFEVGLDLNAGHDLNLNNLPPFLKEVSHVLEVSIGHALWADALEFGMAETIRRYVKACEA